MKSHSGFYRSMYHRLTTLGLMVHDSLYLIIKNPSLYGERKWDFSSRSQGLRSTAAHQHESSWETSSFEFSLVTVVVSLGFVHFFTGLLLFFLMGHMTTSARLWLAMNYLQTVFPALITQRTNTDNIQLPKETLHMYKTGRFLILSYDILRLKI